jgi:hypothetical protein
MESTPLISRIDRDKIIIDAFIDRHQRLLSFLESIVGTFCIILAIDILYRHDAPPFILLWLVIFTIHRIFRFIPIIQMKELDQIYERTLMAIHIITTISGIIYSIIISAENIGYLIIYDIITLIIKMIPYLCTYQMIVGCCAVESVYESISYQLYYDNDSTCSICNKPMSTGNYITQLPCDHECHSECIKIWTLINHNCKTCHQSIT